MAIIGVHPLHGGGQGFESPQLHHQAQTILLPCRRRGRDATRSLPTQLARYTVDARAQNFSPRTVDKMQLGLRLFDEFLGGIGDVRRVTGDDLRRFILALQHRTRWQGTSQAKPQRLADETTRTYAQAVKVFWGWLLRKGTITRNPLANVALPKVGRKLPRTFAEAEVKAIMAAASNLRSQALVWLLLDSGARLGEVTGGDRYPGICLDDIDFQTGAIRVRGKFQLERQVHISRATVEAIQQYLDHERPEPVGPDRLFLNGDGSALTAGRAQKTLEAIGKKAGLKQRVSAHKLRHTHAVLSLKYGSNVEYQRRELGHRHISTTQGYLAICDDDLARAHQSFSPVTNLLSQRRERPHVKSPGWTAERRP
jgi:integrase/recombinase XerD